MNIFYDCMTENMITKRHKNYKRYCLAVDKYVRFGHKETA